MKLMTAGPLVRVRSSGHTAGSRTQDGREQRQFKYCLSVPFVIHDIAYSIVANSSAPESPAGSKQDEQEHPPAHTQAMYDAHDVGS